VPDPAGLPPNRNGFQSLCGGQVPPRPYGGRMSRTAALAATLMLLPAARALAQTSVETVVVSAQRPAIQSTIDGTTYVVSSDLQSETGSVADVLRGLPSVDVDVDGNPSLRGDSSVQIMINGRPSPMFSGADRGAVLQMLGADAVDSIEVIANPSARFSPDGSAGIINIVTKKNYRPGPTGVLRANLGSEGRYNLGINGGYGMGKVTVYGGFNLRTDGRKRRSDTLRANSATGVTSEQIGLGTTQRSSKGGYAGASFELGEKDNLDLDLSYHDRTAQPRSWEHALASSPVGDYRRVGGGGEGGLDKDISAKYRHSFAGEGHELTIDVQLSRDDDSERHTYRNTYLLPPGPDTADDQVSDSRHVQKQLSAEYKRPLPGGAKLDVGYQLQRDDSVFFNGADAIDPVSGALTPNLAQTNRFAVGQTIHALFATWQQPVGKLTVLAGLRVEQVSIDTDQQTSGLVGRSGYLRAYPSLHLEYPLKGTQTLKASYSVRANRPGPDDLNPFVVVQDAFNESAGNPRLTPQMTHALEATWQDSDPKASRSVTAYFRQTENALSDVTLPVGPTLLLSTKENLGRIRSTGFDFAANGKPSKTFSYSLNAYVFDNQVATANEGFSGARTQFSYSGKASVSWRPFPKDLLQLSANYNALRLMPQGYRQPNAGADLGFRHDLGASLAAVVTVSDVFNSRGEKTVIETATVHDVSTRTQIGRATYVGLTWRLSGFRKGSQQDERFNF
jgi:outer membrane receptor protein involved in Fe transport